MESKGYVIAKLNGSNYFLWRFKLEMLLQKEKLWCVIEDETPATVTAEWKVKDQSAKASIGLSLEDKILINIIDCRTAKETWIRLKTLYEHSNLTSKLYLLKKLYGIRYEEYSNMEDYLNCVREITERLRAIGEIIKEAHLVAVILCGLPENYSPLITALEAKDEDVLTVEYVSEKLRDEAKRKESYNQGQEELSTALASNHIRPDYYKRNKIVCHHCGQEGHIKRNCRVLDHNMPGNHSRCAPGSSNNQQNRMPEERSNHCNYYSSETMHEGMKNQQSGGCINETRNEIPEEWALTGTNRMEKYEVKAWVLDSGASSHMSSNEKNMTNITELIPPVDIQMANGDNMRAVAKGNLIIEITGDRQGVKQIQLKNVLVIPDLKHNLISIAVLCEVGYTVEFYRNNCVIKMLSEVIAKGERHGNIFTLTMYDHGESTQCLTCVHGWHKRLGHRNITGIKQLENSKLVKDLVISKCKHSDFCRICQIGSMTRTQFKTSLSSNTKPYQTLVSDICGPITPSTYGGKKYLLTVTDNYSNFTYVDILKSKSDVSQSVIKFLEVSHNKFQYWPEVFRSDGGGEYCGREFEHFLTTHGITHQTTIRNTPQQNGKSERKNRTLFNMIRCMLKSKKLPLELWGEAAMTSAHIINRIQHSDRTITPHELWHGHPPSVGYFKEFGCEAYAYVDKQDRGKLGDTAVEGIFVGYGIGKKGYRIWIPGTVKIINAISARFKELETGDEGEHSRPLTGNDNNLFEFCPNSTNTMEKNPTDIEDRALRRSDRSNKGVPAKRLSY